jgi:hypothetical protein
MITINQADCIGKLGGGNGLMDRNTNHKQKGHANEAAAI